MYESIGATYSSAARPSKCKWGRSTPLPGVERAEVSGIGRAICDGVDEPRPGLERAWQKWRCRECELSRSTFSFSSFSFSG